MSLFAVGAELFIIFTSSETFDFDEFFENIAKLAMMEEAEIFDIGHAVSDIATI